MHNPARFFWSGSTQHSKQWRTCKSLQYINVTFRKRFNFVGSPKKSAVSKNINPFFSFEIPIRIFCKWTEISYTNNHHSIRFSVEGIFWKSRQNQVCSEYYIGVFSLFLGRSCECGYIDKPLIGNIKNTCNTK